jgi:hypothetical protein
LHAVGASDAAEVCDELVAFSHDVDAQTGKKLGTAQPATLLSRVQT